MSSNCNVVAESSAVLSVPRVCFTDVAVKIAKVFFFDKNAGW